MLDLDNPKLIAVKNGFPPHADPLVCGDIIGPESFFGNRDCVPKILRKLKKDDFNIEEDIFASLLRSDAAVLWEKVNPLGDCPSKNKKNEACDYSIASDTFLIGEAQSSFDVAWHLHNLNIMKAWSTVLVTKQKEGRGQMRRNWHSPQGNLHATFMLPKDPAYESQASAIVLAYTLVSAFRDMGIELFLKWPNDLVSKDCKKLGGVLVEERNGALMAGFGFNIKKIPDKKSLHSNNSLLPASFSSQFPDMKKFFCPFFLWQELVSKAILAYTSTVAGRDLSDIMHLANEFLIIKNKHVFVITGKDHKKSGFCHGFSPNGALLVDFGDGQKLEFSSGSVIPA